MRESDSIDIDEADKKRLARMGTVVGALTKAFSIAATGASVALAAHYGYEAAQGAIEPALALSLTWLNSMALSATWSMATTFLAFYYMETVNEARKNVINRYADQGMEKLAQEQDAFLQNLGSREGDAKTLDDTDLNILATIPDEKFLDSAAAWACPTILNTLVVYKDVVARRAVIGDVKTYFRDLADNRMKVPEKRGVRIDNDLKTSALFMAGLLHFSGLRHAFNGHWAVPSAADFSLPAPEKPDPADVASHLKKRHTKENTL